SGDTLSGIAQTVGASSAEVAGWNEMSRDAIIHPGQRILLRGTPPAGAGAAPAPAPSPAAQSADAGVTHTVAQGDTLWDLSIRYGVSVEQIQALNQMSGNNLRIGQVLVIRVVE
ncbi:MAG TPA: LysM peptidoglycan-binding domain-containing protein, partial [Candidatus Fermentibacter sp.]|nr:LysM peptidoglycan-binding domain-containing protein [Candidatus Fermentibacter sp.]